jgi:hypothetical protein
MHYTKHRTQARRLGDWTIGNYAPRTGHGFTWGLTAGVAQREAAWRYARKRGWTIRTDYRGYVKVFDVVTGNVSFARETPRAVWGLKCGIEHTMEISAALVRLIFRA